MSKISKLETTFAPTNNGTGRLAMVSPCSIILQQKKHTLLIHTAMLSERNNTPKNTQLKFHLHEVQSQARLAYASSAWKGTRETLLGNWHCFAPPSGVVTQGPGTYEFLRLDLHHLCILLYVNYTSVFEKMIMYLGE